MLFTLNRFKISYILLFECKELIDKYLSQFLKSDISKSDQQIEKC